MDGINHTRRHTFKGTLSIFSSELLILPTGILAVSFLTRKLGPHEFGLFILVSTIVTWIEWSINAIFGRASIKFIGEAKDWKPIGGITTRLYLLFSLIIMSLLLLLAGPISHSFNEPSLTNYLRLFSLDIPIFGLAQSHRQILVGTGAFKQRAYLSAGRWIGRLILIILFVQLGMSVTGAILGCIGASCIELIIGRYFIQVPVFSRSPFDLRKFFNYAISLSLSGFSMRTFDKMDLLMLKLLGGTAVAAGVYGAAQNLSILPGIFALSFSPLLLSALIQLISTGDEVPAKELVRDSIRLTILMFPFGALVAGASGEIVKFFFGQLYFPAAPLLALLIFSALSVSMTSIATAILVASGKPGLTFFIVGPCVPLAFLGHLFFIPRLGSIGASLVTTVLSVLCAIITVAAVYRIFRTLPSFGTFLRTSIIGLGIWMAASFWPAEGFYLFFKLMCLGILILVSYVLLGEFTSKEIEFARAFILNKR